MKRPKKKTKRPNKTKKHGANPSKKTLTPEQLKNRHAKFAARAKANKEAQK